jgi:hypothetical protein
MDDGSLDKMLQKLEPNVVLEASGYVASRHARMSST